MRTPPLQSSRAFLLAVTMLLPVLLASCGGAASTTPVASSPFTAEDAVVFDDGVDYVEDPEALDGRWREEWGQEMEKRVRASDLIVVVSVPTVRTDTDLDRRTTYRLLANTQRTIFGAAQSELILSSAEGAAGYASVERHMRQVMANGMIAFIKWETIEDGSVRARWHLSPASTMVVRHTESGIEERTGQRSNRARVIDVTR